MIIRVFIGKGDGDRQRVIVDLIVGGVARRVGGYNRISVSAGAAGRRCGIDIARLRFGDGEGRGKFGEAH